MVEPGGAFPATFTAAANVPPAVMPTKIPSLRASCWLILMPSGPGDGDDLVDQLLVDRVAGDASE